MVSLGDIKEILVTEAKLLAFRPVKPDLTRLGHAYLCLGLFCTWLVGMGRYWDNPRAELWQTLGLGSLGYVFVMAAILWVIILPLGPRNWSYLGVLTFVGLTSPPALLYAIPVERWVTLDTAQVINVWFLAAVALWRVVLLLLYLKRAAGLSYFATVVGTVLPLTLIVITLSFLNLEHVIFRLMAGLREEDASPNDGAYIALLLISWFAFIASPLALAAYGWLCWRQRRKRTLEVEQPKPAKTAGGQQA